MASLAAKTGISGEKTKTQNKIGIGHSVNISFKEDTEPTAFPINEETKDTPIGKRLIGEKIPKTKTSFTTLSDNKNLNAAPMSFYVHEVN